MSRSRPGAGGEVQREGRVRGGVRDRETAAFGFGEGAREDEPEAVSVAVRRTAREDIIGIREAGSFVADVEGEAAADGADGERDGAVAVAVGVGDEDVEDLGKDALGGSGDG